MQAWHHSLPLWHGPVTHPYFRGEGMLARRSYRHTYNPKRLLRIRGREDIAIELYRLENTLPEAAQKWRALYDPSRHRSHVRILHWRETYTPSRHHAVPLASATHRSG